jgi:hypothetical protein
MPCTTELQATSTSFHFNHHTACHPSGRVLLRTPRRCRIGGESCYFPHKKKTKNNVVFLRCDSFDAPVDCPPPPTHLTAHVSFPPDFQHHLRHEAYTCTITSTKLPLTRLRDRPAATLAAISRNNAEENAISDVGLILHVTYTHETLACLRSVPTETRILIQRTVSPAVCAPPYVRWPRGIPTRGCNTAPRIDASTRRPRNPPLYSCVQDKKRRDSHAAPKTTT